MKRFHSHHFLHLDKDIARVRRVESFIDIVEFFSSGAP